MKTPLVRLDRLLGNLGYGSRRDIARLAAWGAVLFDGKPLRDSAQKVPLDPNLPDRLTIQGRPVDPPSPLTVIMHKPLGVVCSHKEPGRSVYEVLPARWRGRDPALSTIGRLDVDTTGLLLITDDGDLLHRIISPRNKVAKVYLADLARPLRGDEAAVFASGELRLESEEQPVAAARLEVLSPRQARLTITEGRYHQVRRMFAAVGNHVDALHREQIGELPLPADLGPGDWRIATVSELSQLSEKPHQRAD